jgi:hypothetical protein
MKREKYKRKLGKKKGGVVRSTTTPELGVGVDRASLTQKIPRFSPLVLVVRKI